MNQAKQSSTTKVVLYTMIILSFIILESPFIMFANKVEPIILGMPFLFAWLIMWWAVLTILFLIGYLINWGDPKEVEHRLEQGKNIQA